MTDRQKEKKNMNKKNDNSEAQGLGPCQRTRALWLYSHDVDGAVKLTSVCSACPVWLLMFSKRRRVPLKPVCVQACTQRPVGEVGILHPGIPPLQAPHGPGLLLFECADPLLLYSWSRAAHDYTQARVLTRAEWRPETQPWRRHGSC